MDTQPETGSHRLLRLIARLEDSILVLLLATMIFLAVTEIFLRNFFQTAIPGAGSVISVLVLWVGMFGAVVATRERKQISIDVLSHYLSEKAKHIIGIIVDIFVIVVCMLLSYHAIRMMMEDYEAGAMAFLNVPTWLASSALPIALTMIALRYLLFAWHNIHALREGRAHK